MRPLLDKIAETTLRFYRGRALREIPVFLLVREIDDKMRDLSTPIKEWRQLKGELKRLLAHMIPGDRTEHAFSELVTLHHEYGRYRDAVRRVQAECAVEAQWSQRLSRLKEELPELRDEVLTEFNRTTVIPARGTTGTAVLLLKLQYRLDNWDVDSLSQYVKKGFLWPRNPSSR